jgi:O-antigen/teichoic acid export membrane protein
MGGEKVIFLVRLIILARLLSPEDFGLVAIGMTVLAIGLSLTDFGVVAALIQRPANDKRHLDTAFTIGLIRGFAVTVVLIVAAPWIAEGFAEPRAVDLVRALALTALIQAAASIEVARLNRELRFGGLAGIRLSAAIANTVVAIALARSHGAWALVWGAVAGAVTQTTFSYIVAPYRPALRLSEDASASIARFGRWIFVIGVLSVAGDAALRWLIATRLGVVELGLFFMAVRLAFLPAQLISEIVGEVAFPVYAHLDADRGKAASTFRGLLISVAALLVPTCLVFAWLVPDLVQQLLGERWEGAVVVMQLLILSSVVGLLGDGLTPVLKGIGHPAGIAAMDSLQLLLIVAVGWPMIGAFGLVGAGVAWLTATFASQILAAWYARRLFDQPFADLALPVLAIVTAAVLATVVAGLAGNALSGFFGIAVAVLAAGTTAISVTVVLDRYLALGILQTILEPFPRLRRFAGSSSA